jgi:hypothetical protein
MMNFITINTDNLELSLVDSEPESGFLIPTKKSRHDVLERDFHGLVYHRVLYPYVTDKDKTMGKTKTAYSLVDPDPWLIALAAIMWQGLIQGLTWDTIKLATLKGVEFLRSNKLVAEEPYPREGWKRSKKKKSSGIEVGLSWTKFSEDGEPLRKFFLGVKREYEKLSEEERESIKHHYVQKFSGITNQSTGRKKTAPVTGAVRAARCLLWAMKSKIWKIKNCQKVAKSQKFHEVPYKLSGELSLLRVGFCLR